MNQNVTGIARGAALRLPFWSMMLERIRSMMDVPAEKYVETVKTLIDGHLSDAAIVYAEVGDDQPSGKAPCKRPGCDCHLSRLDQLKNKATKLIAFAEREPAAGLSLAVLVIVNQQMQWSVSSFQELTNDLLDSLRAESMEWLENPQGRFQWGFNATVTAASPIQMILDALNVPPDQYKLNIVDVREMKRLQDSKKRYNPIEEMLKNMFS